MFWQGPVFNFSGYGDEGRALIYGLLRQGFPLSLRSWADSVEFMEQFSESAPERLVELHRATVRPVGSPFMSILHGPGYMATPVHGAIANVTRSMFETDSLPSDWVPRLNRMDEIWVPASFNVTSFRQAGVTVPIEVVPGGVDATLYRPGLRPLRIPGTRGIVFLAVFEWSFRKGWDVLLKAWAEAFGPNDDVSLVLRTAPFTGGVRADTSVSDLIDRHLESIGHSRRNVAPIVLMDWPVSREDFPRLYATADVFVSSSRGEGWGRPMMEAMASRLPTVATRWSGNLDFMDDDNSMLIDVEGIVPVDNRSEFTFFRGQCWAEPSAPHLADIMRRLAAEPDLRRRLGARARQDIERRWQWKYAQAAMADRVDTLVARERDLRAGSGAGRGAGLTVSNVAPCIRWEGDFYAHHSLAGVNRALAGRLTAKGALWVSPMTREAPPYPVDTESEVNDLQRAMPPGVGGVEPDVVVRHRWPPDLEGAGQSPLVLIQPWEFGGIPSAWVGPITRHVTEVWCPTTWVADCYIRSGVPEARVAVVPNGVDTELLRPDGPVRVLATSKSRKLLFVGGTITRKGIDVLLRSYLHTFSATDDVCLVVKSFGASHVYRGSTIDDQLAAVAADPTTPEVELIDEELTDEEMAALYRSCDVLVHPYRGEGFGLPIAEAMASGLPVVVTGYGACLDFCDEENAVLVPATVTPVEARHLGPSSIGYWWAEPDEAALGQILRRVVDAPHSLAGMGAAGRRRILQSFTWDAVAELAQTRLLALARGGQGG